jgi:hypothetical protein
MHFAYLESPGEILSQPSRFYRSRLFSAVRSAGDTQEEEDTYVDLVGEDMVT